MTNPDDIVRYNTRNGGRGSYAGANAWTQYYTPGAMSQSAVRASEPAGLGVTVGATNSANPMPVLATTPSGLRVALELTGSTVLTISRPLSNQRISAVVAYTNDLALASTQSAVTGSPASCGLIVVPGTDAASPVPPTDAQIRSAITADGGTGSSAAYAILGLVTIASDTTAITDNMIAAVMAGSAPVPVMIQNGVNLNSFSFASPGVYYCRTTATAQTLTNCPTRIAFRMEVTSFGRNGDQNVSYDSLWQYLYRRIIDIFGNEWVQVVSSGGTAGSWTFSKWAMTSGGTADGEYSGSAVITAKSGYEITEANAYRQGKLVVLSLIIYKTSGNFGGQASVATIAAGFCPRYTINTFCVLSTSEWSAHKGVGYAYLTAAGDVMLADSSNLGCSYAKIQITVPTA